MDVTAPMLVAVSSEPVDWAFAATVLAGVGLTVWREAARSRDPIVRHRRAMRALRRAARTRR